MTDYNSNHIQVLEDIEHVKLNPAMYIGDTENPHHLLEEAFDNALDEALTGYNKKIIVQIDTKKHEYSVIDFGRGIPIDNDIPITISTKLFTGAKFKDKKTAYKICSGLHGCGLVTLLALSKKYTIEIYRDEKYAIYEFKNSQLVKKKISAFKTSKKPFSTKISFIPNRKYFETVELDISYIRDRLTISSIEIPQCEYILEVDNKQEIIKSNKYDYFKNRVCKDDTVLDFIEISTKVKEEVFSILFTFATEGTITPRFTSSVNILPVSGGGVHYNIFTDIMANFFITKAKKYGITLDKQDCLCGLRAYFSLLLLQPEFFGQSKYKLNNKKSYFDKFVNKIRVVLDNYFSDKENKLLEILEHFNLYRKRLQAKKVRNSNGYKNVATRFTKLRDCAKLGGELFIVEGESAGGALIAARNPEKHAILPLKGKIPNIVNKQDILSNKEVKELIESLGTGIAPNFNINNLKYDKIICAVDADFDGGHIFVLLTMVLANLVPEIIKQGKYYLAACPLYAITEKNSFIPLWNEKDLTKAVNQNKKITRFKGLGELNPEQLEKVLLDEFGRKLIQVKYSDLTKLNKLLTDVNEKRKLLQNKKIPCNVQEVFTSN